MRVKNLEEPMGIVQKGDEWLSPEGHSPTWRRVWNGLGWDCEEGPIFPVPVEPELEEPQIDPESLEEIEIEIAGGDDQPEEDHDDEQGMQTAVSDRDGGEQGASGGSSPESEQRGKRGKVRKGRKGK